MAWQARFRSMDEGDRDEWMRVLDREHATQWGEVADGTIALLESMKDADPLGYPVNVYGHSLQSATRALRDGASEEMVVVALFHDIGNLLAPHDHGAMSALVMAPYVSEESIWLLRHHATFQQYYYMGQLGLNRDGREKFRGHPAFEMTERFCERWDQAAFDAHYDVLPIESFVPMVHRVMGAPVRSAAEAAHLAMTL
jgi:predicted HD phosphohydrolase